MATATTGARERLLAAADELFYEHGVQTVGIDRVIERAGVAKASLYSIFGSKDELIRAYLLQRDASMRQRMTTALDTRYQTPRERLLGVLDVLSEWVARPGYRGCAFANASTEAGAGSAIHEASAEFRGWLRGLLVDLSREAGAADPQRLAQALQLLYDGVGISVRMDHHLSGARAAREAAEVLVDAATATSAVRRPARRSR